MREKESTDTREYPYSVQTMLNAINDLVELQKGKVTFDDIPGGKLFFTVEMYGFQWENQFTVKNLGNNRSSITLAIRGDALSKTDKISGQFAILDSLLVSTSQEGPSVEQKESIKKARKTKEGNKLLQFYQKKRGQPRGKKTDESSDKQK